MYEQLSGEEIHPDNLLYPLLLTLFLWATTLLHTFLSLYIPHNKNSQPYCHYCSIFPAVLFAPVAFALLSALFAARASCGPLPSPFSVAVLLSSPSLGQGDRLTETNALHGSYLHGKGWLHTTLTLTAGLKDVSYLVNLLQSPLWWCYLREYVNYGWHENELWGATSWEPAKGGILSSLKWDFSLMLWLVSVPKPEMLFCGVVGWVKNTEDLRTPQEYHWSLYYRRAGLSGMGQWKCRGKSSVKPGHFWGQSCLRVLS